MSTFAKITENGITAPTYDEIVEINKSRMREIYGDDIYLENDSQDGQLIGVQALAMHDCNNLFIDLYNSFSPDTANHDALIRNVKINGIQLQDSSKTTIGLRIVGVAGTALKNCIATDSNNNRWLIPTITIDSSGAVIVTATAEKDGIIIAQPNSITTIATPTRGWVSVTNPASSNLGSPLETDLKLRQRQKLSTENSALSLPEAIRGMILAVDGVTRCRVFENKTNVVDGNSLPPHSFCAVVYGGDAAQIAQVIKSKKPMGCALYGNTNTSLLNTYGESEKYSFYRASLVNIGYALKIETNDSYSADTGTTIQELLAEYTNNLNIGEKITRNKIVGVANLNGAAQSQTYEVIEISIVVNGVMTNTDYVLPFGSVAFCDVLNVAIEVVSG